MKVIIIGAGLTGLSAAESIGDRAEVQIFEQENEAGGLARTHIHDGFIHDATGHFLHFNDNRIEKKVKSFFNDDELLEISRRSFIYTHETFIPYPFQSHINYLPDNLKRECLVGFLENLKTENKSDDNNFYKWMLNQYGKGIVKYFMEPYNQKMWTVHPKELTLEWMSRFVPKPSPEEIISGTITRRKNAQGYNATFYYPKKGIGELVKKYIGRVGDIELESRVDKINWKDKIVTINDKECSYDFLITTCPLKTLIGRMLEPEDKPLLKHAGRLRHTSLVYYNIGWKGGPGKKLPEGTHWLYFPEEKFIFYRVGFPPAISPEAAPEGHYSCYVEISYPETGIPGRKEIEGKIFKKIFQDLIDAEIISSDAVPVQKGIARPITAYVIYDKNWKASREYILNWLEERNIFPGGRYGGWEYSAMEDAILWGERLAKKCLSK